MNPFPRGMARQPGLGEPGDVQEKRLRERPLCGGNSAKLTTSLGGPMSTGAPWQIQKLPPDVYTVKLMPLDLPAFDPTGAAILVSAYADIVFGAQGQIAKRRVSIGQGVSISGQADYVAVTVTDNTAAVPVDRQPAPITYMVTMVVAPGVRADSLIPPMLAPTDANGYLLQPSAMALAATGTLTIPIPQNVGVTSVQCTVCDTTGAALTENAAVIQQLGNGRVGISQNDPRDAGGFFPLYPGAAAIQLNNVTCPNLVQFTLLFGIDG